MGPGSAFATRIHTLRSDDGKEQLPRRETRWDPGAETRWSRDDGLSPLSERGMRGLPD
jgi:hypothetical protein